MAEETQTVFELGCNDIILINNINVSTKYIKCKYYRIVQPINQSRDLKTRMTREHWSPVSEGLGLGLETRCQVLVSRQGSWLETKTET